MILTITGRHFELDPELENYARDEMNSLNDKYKRFVDAEVIFIKEKYRHIAEITVHVDGNRYYAKEESDDMYISFNRTIDKVETQIKKFRNKRRERARQANKEKQFGSETPEIDVDEYLEEEMGEPIIVEMEMSYPKPMNDEEAAMQLKMGNNLFLPFINANTNEMNVLYKRTDGNFGLIRPPKH